MWETLLFTKKLTAYRITGIFARGNIALGACYDIGLNLDWKDSVTSTAW
jgi:hypothetical protein